MAATNLTNEQRDRLHATQQKIERTIEISLAIRRLESATKSVMTGSEGLRNAMHNAAFMLEEGPIKEITSLIQSKLQEQKSALERELSEVRQDANVEQIISSDAR